MRARVICRIRIASNQFISVPLSAAAIRYGWTQV